MELDDLKVGEFVTVIQGKKYLPFGGYDNVTNTVYTEVQEDGSYKGDILEVKAIEIPYVVFYRHDRHAHNQHPITLDMREWKVMKIGQDFINASLGK
jgi:hypothetical protein